MIIDVTSFNGELDILEIRLNILNDFVDQFIIVESRNTFSGKPKPLYYEENKERYKKWEHKIKYHIIDEDFKEGVVALADGSPNVPKGGAENWKREFCQKEQIKEALTHLNDDDLVFIGDCDEVWNPEHMTFFDCVLGVEKMKLSVRTYFLNNYSSEQFWGTIYGKYGDIKDKCLNHLRSTDSHRFDGKYGWHFTSMGGYEEVRRKLSDSYTRDSYWTPWVENNLKDNVEGSKDFLGRNFTYKIDESELPQYLIDNKEKWKHLFR